MEFINDLVQYSYLQNALWAAILSGITCGLVGTYIVARRRVFLAGGITHASFGGLGAAFYFGAEPLLGAMVAAVAAALGIEWAEGRMQLREDSAIGILWAVGMALGALFMSLTPGYTSGDMTAYLFGSIITVTSTDIGWLALLTAVVVVGAALWLRPVMYVAFDRSFAQSRGIHTRLIGFVMGILMALAIVLSIRIMGIVLLIALLTMPVVGANMVSKAYNRIAWIAPVLAVFGNIIGLYLSYIGEVPPGAAIIFTLSVMLFSIKLLTLSRQN